MDAANGGAGDEVVLVGGPPLSPLSAQCPLRLAPAARATRAPPVGVLFCVGCCPVSLRSEVDPGRGPDDARRVCAQGLMEGPCCFLGELGWADGVCR